MREVDGFTLIDYIKSSIEILMNMKIEENDQKEESDYNNLRHRKKGATKGTKKFGENQHIDKPDRPIPKIDDKTPTSSIRDL